MLAAARTSTRRLPTRAHALVRAAPARCARPPSLPASRRRPASHPLSRRLPLAARAPLKNLTKGCMWRVAGEAAVLIGASSGGLLRRTSAPPRTPRHPRRRRGRARQPQRRGRAGVLWSGESTTQEFTDPPPTLSHQSPARAGVETR